MRHPLVLVAVVMLVACGKESPTSSSPAPGQTEPAPKATATATTGAAATTTTAAAVNTAAYRGIKPGHGIGGYLRDPKETGACVVVTLKPGEKTPTSDEFKKIADMVKGEVTPSCPTENIVGACFSFGMAEQYYGPKFTRESARAACRGVWSD